MLQTIWFEYKKYCLIGIGITAVLLASLVSGVKQNSHLDNKQTVETSHKPANSRSKSNEKQLIYVDVKGAVKKPGVYALQFGMRAQDAVERAGGLTSLADQNHVNMAQQVRDQQVVYVPAKGEVTTPIGQTASEGNVTSGDGQSESGPIVNINTAGKEELMKITGIGDKKADLILEYRQQHGQFKSVKELQNVSGFGEISVSKIKDQISI
jgi:competence protein ComEA